MVVLAQTAPPMLQQHPGGSHGRGVAIERLQCKQPGKEWKKPLPQSHHYLNYGRNGKACGQRRSQPVGRSMGSPHKSSGSPVCIIYFKLLIKVVMPSYLFLK